MRTLPLFFVALLASVSAQDRTAASAPACTTATERCTEWVSLGSRSARSLIYRSRSLDARNDNVRRALIMVHGTNRNADHYFSTAVTAAFLAGALDDAVVRSWAETDASNPTNSKGRVRMSKTITQLPVQVRISAVGV